MKHFIIPLLVLFLLLLTPTAALAADEKDDGMEVDIDIDSGGDVGVDIDIDADGDVDVTISGWTPPSSGGVGLESLANHMGVTKLKKTVGNLADNLVTVANGLAKVINVVGNDHTHELAEHEAEIYNQSVELGSHLWRIEDLEETDEYVLGRLSSLDEKIDTKDTELQNRLTQMEDEYSKRLTVIVAAFSAAFILLAITLVVLLKRRR